MANFFSRWFGGTSAIADRSGLQTAYPSQPVTTGLKQMTPELAMQVGAIYACVDLVASTVSSLPMHVYKTDRNGHRELARDSSLWFLLHESPNSVMTPMEFWRAMLLQHQLRGNAYALINRSENNDPDSMTPLNADQMEVATENGKLFYRYTKDGETTDYPASRILHLRALGNGVIGLSKLDCMRTSTTEALHAQEAANGLFGNANKPSGVLTVDHVLSKEQRESIKSAFSGMQRGQESGLFILEADMHYSPLSLTPAETQLLETRKYSVAEIARWFGVPPVLISGDSATTWGSGIEQIIEGFHRFTLRPLLVSIEQALRKQVFSNVQRTIYSAEFSLDALLRSSEASRYEIYAKACQNGLMTRNECRQLENLDPVDGGDELTVQSNLVPIKDLGKLVPSREDIPETQETIKQ